MWIAFFLCGATRVPSYDLQGELKIFDRATTTFVHYFIHVGIAFREFLL
jgi:hypothetical protein